MDVDSALVEVASQATQLAAKGTLIERGRSFLDVIYFAG